MALVNAKIQKSLAIAKLFSKFPFWEIHILYAPPDMSPEPSSSRQNHNFLLITQVKQLVCICSVHELAVGWIPPL
jgi:hypothetical protein